MLYPTEQVPHKTQQRRTLQFCCAIFATILLFFFFVLFLHNSSVCLFFSHSHPLLNSLCRIPNCRVHFAKFGYWFGISCWATLRHEAHTLIVFGVDGVRARSPRNLSETITFLDFRARTQSEYPNIAEHFSVSIFSIFFYEARKIVVRHMFYFLEGVKTIRFFVSN